MQSLPAPRNPRITVLPLKVLPWEDPAAVTALAQSGCHFLLQPLVMSEKEMLAIPNFTPAHFADLQTMLNGQDLSVGMMSHITELRWRLVTVPTLLKQKDSGTKRNWMDYFEADIRELYSLNGLNPMEAFPRITTQLFHRAASIDKPASQYTTDDTAVFCEVLAPIFKPVF